MPVPLSSEDIGAEILNNLFAKWLKPTKDYVKSLWGTKIFKEWSLNAEKQAVKKLHTSINQHDDKHDLMPIPVKSAT